MSDVWAGEIIDVLENVIDGKNFRGYKICTVKTTSPFVFTYNEIEIGATKGDTVYVHPLFISSVIEQDTDDLQLAQTFNSSTAYNSPSFSAEVEGTIPDFLKEFYLFYENWQSIFVLAPGDLIAVYELGKDRYLVLQKVILDKENEN